MDSSYLCSAFIYQVWQLFGKHVTAVNVLNAPELHT